MLLRGSTPCESTGMVLAAVLLPLLLLLLLVMLKSPQAPCCCLCSPVASAGLLLSTPWLESTYASMQSRLKQLTVARAADETAAEGRFRKHDRKASC